MSLVCYDYGMDTQTPEVKAEYEAWLDTLKEAN